MLVKILNDCEVLGMNIKNVLMGVITDEDLLNYYNAKKLYTKLVPEVNGYVLLYRGIYTVIINKYKSKKKIKDTIIHELAHIELCQLEQCNKDYLLMCCRNDLEDEADEYIKNIEKEICDLEKR